MLEVLDVLRSAGFAPTGTSSRSEALAAIWSQDELIAVVAGGSVDWELEADLRAAAEPKGARVVRADLGNDHPGRYVHDRVLPVLEQLRAPR
jgi:hypothetical protein